ncbi:MAG: hypothetical protein ABJC09_05280 [Terriglobia bacterium]
MIDFQKYVPVLQTCDGSRTFLGNTPAIVDGVLGGWQIAGSWTANSGPYLEFPALAVSGDPTISNPTPAKWFDTSKFAQQSPYVVQTNPDHFRDLRGPLYWDIDATLSKRFKITEKVGTELKAESYNLTNRLNRANPDLSVTSPTFGQSLRQSVTVGRQIELGLRIIF